MKKFIYKIAVYVLAITLIGCKGIKLDTNPFDDGKVGIEIDVEEILEEELSSEH